MSRNILTDWPVRKIRPLEGMREVERYDEATDSFVTDDGQPSLAFSGVSKDGYPLAYWVDLPYDDNIVSKWKDNKGTWHLETRDGTLGYGESYEGRDTHPNEMAGRRAMSRTSDRYRCANGRPDESVTACVGKCVRCVNDGLGHRIEDARNDINRAQSDIYSFQHNLKRAEEDVVHFTKGLLHEQQMLKEYETNLEKLLKEVAKC